MQRTFSVFVLLFLAHLLYGQISELSISDKNKLDNADEQFRIENYFEALALYLQLQESFPENLDILSRIGVTYYMMGDFPSAISHLEKVIESASSIDVYLRYYYAESNHLNGHYKTALEQYEICYKYIAIQDPEIDTEQLQKKMEQCRTAMHLPDLSNELSEIEIINAVNSNANETNPVWVDEPSELWFTRSDMENGSKNPNNAIYLYEAKKQSVAKSDKFQSKKFKGLIFLGFTNKGTRALFWSSNGTGDLYLGNMESSDYVIEKIDGDMNTNEFDESSITVSEKDNKVYFSSNRTDLHNYGGYDIYTGTITNTGEITDIKNLGEQINSIHDETGVFWCEPDRSLYFSSNSTKSCGGFDVFKAVENENGTFREVVNVGFPINSTADELNFIKYGKKICFQRKVQSQNSNIVCFEISEPRYDSNWYKKEIDGIKKLTDYQVIDNVFFDKGESWINPKDNRIVTLANHLKQIPEAEIVLSGYCDTVGDMRTNYILASHRVANVMNALILNGINPKTIELKIFGEYFPDKALDKTTETGGYKWSRMVRVQIKKQDNNYTIVKYPNENINFWDIEKIPEYGVMVYVSPNSSKQIKKDSSLNEVYSVKSKLYYYCSEKYKTIEDAEKGLKEYATKYPNAYLFTTE